MISSRSRSLECCIAAAAAQERTARDAAVALSLSLALAPRVFQKVIEGKNFPRKLVTAHRCFRSIQDIVVMVMVMVMAWEERSM